MSAAGRVEGRSFLNYLKSIDHQQRVTIDIQWVQILDTFGWKDNPPPEIINLAPFFLGTQRADDQQRRHWPYLLLGQKLTWLLPQQLLAHLGPPQLGAELAANPSALPAIIKRYGPEHSTRSSAALPPALPEPWQGLIILRDRLYIRARQNLPEISELLDDSDQLIKKVLLSVNGQSGSVPVDQAKQQIIANIEAEMLSAVVAALTQRHDHQSAALPFPWEPFFPEE